MPPAPVKAEPVIAPGYPTAEGEYEMYTQPLNRTNIANAVERKHIGNYWLGKYLPNEIFQATYVGRSDTCLQRRLIKYVKDEQYDAFVLRVAISVREAYEIECREWHMISRGLNNEIHPRSPRHLPYSCPYCDFQELLDSPSTSKGGEN